MFLQEFQVFFKRMLQKYSKILKRSFLSTTCVVVNFQQFLHNNVLSLVAREGINAFSLNCICHEFHTYIVSFLYTVHLPIMNHLYIIYWLFLLNQHFLCLTKLKVYKLFAFTNSFFSTENPSETVSFNNVDYGNV